MVAPGDRNLGCRGVRIAYEEGLMQRKSLRSQSIGSWFESRMAHQKQHLASDPPLLSPA